MTPSPDTLGCIARLIAFDTVSHNSNVACMEWARGLLEGEGAVCRLDWNPERTKVNMLATFGEGPGGLLFSGHVDVVPVEGQAWASDPFQADIRDGRLYGRGACDMKGFVGSVLAHAGSCRRAADTRPVHIALTYDEEVGCLGVPHLVRAMQGWGVRPAGAIIGEPTSMRLVSSHKGGRVYRARVTGHAAHSSLTHAGVNAIEYAALLIARIHAIGARERESGLRGEGFDVPFTTISTNLISGGNAPNIIPALAQFQFDYRYVPGADPLAIIAELEALAAELRDVMRARAPEADIAFELVNAIPALNAAETDWVFGLVHGALPDKAVEKVGYGTEASFFEAAGTPSIVCGPGSIEQAHKADEYVTLEQLAACDRMIEAVLAA